MATVGETISEVWETGVVGETFATHMALINGMEAAWEPTFTEIGDGFYTYTLIPEVPGFYSWSGEGSGSGPFTINIEVDPFAAVTPPTPGTPVGTTTLDRLVEHVALRSMDLIQATATRNEVGLQTFTDVNNLIEDNAFFAGMELHFTTGPNAGLTRRIAYSEYDSGTLSWELPVFAPVLVGTEINIYNRSGLGHLYKEYKNALNMVIREVGGNVMQRIDVEVAVLPDSWQPVITLDPNTISKVCRISYLDCSGVRQSLRRNRHHGWWSDHGSGQVTLTGNAIGIVTSSTPPLKAHGYLKPQELRNGTDATFIDPEWLVETAAGLLQNANPDNAGNLAPGQYLRNRADAMRGKMATPFDANCVSVS